MCVWQIGSTIHRFYYQWLINLYFFTHHFPGLVSGFFSATRQGISRRLRGASVYWEWSWRWPVSSASLCIWVRRQWICLRLVTRWAAAVPTRFPTALFWAALWGCVWILLTPWRISPLADHSQLSFTLQQAVKKCAIIVLLLRGSWWWINSRRRWDRVLTIPSTPPLFGWRKWAHVRFVFFISSGIISVVFKLIFITVVMLRRTIVIRRISTEF